jgi:hypothetical protein
MERKELVLVIRDYVDSLPEEEKYCNGCINRQLQRPAGARGQVVTAFGNGICRCDEHELMWAYGGNNKINRPLECILNGEKYISKKSS